MYTLGICTNFYFCVFRVTLNKLTSKDTKDILTFSTIYYNRTVTITNSIILIKVT